MRNTLYSRIMQGETTYKDARKYRFLVGFLMGSCLILGTALVMSLVF